MSLGPIPTLLNHTPRWGPFSIFRTWLDVVSAGAELQSLCREAAHAALREDLGAHVVAMHHFKQALAASKPALTEETLHKFAAWPL